MSTELFPISIFGLGVPFDTKIPREMIIAELKVIINKVFDIPTVEQTFHFGSEELFDEERCIIHPDATTMLVFNRRDVYAEDPLFIDFSCLKV